MSFRTGRGRFGLVPDLGSFGCRIRMSLQQPSQWPNTVQHRNNALGSVLDGTFLLKEGDGEASGSGKGSPLTAAFVYRFDLAI